MTLLSYIYMYIERERGNEWMDCQRDEIEREREGINRWIVLREMNIYT